MRGVLPQTHALLPAQPAFLSKSGLWGFFLSVSCPSRTGHLTNGRAGPNMEGVLPQTHALLPASPVLVSKSGLWGFFLQRMVLR